MRSLGHAPEKRKHVPSKTAQIEMFLLGKCEKIFHMKKLL